MLLMTEPDAPPGCWSFPGRPMRRENLDADDASWRDHPLAPAVEALLAERGLDEQDIKLFVDCQLLYAITGCWPHEFLAGPNGSDAADVAAALGPDLDHLVAWRRRDAMIAATIGTPDEAGPWIVPATCDAPGGIGPAPGAAFGDAVPLWAVTASTALLGHLARSGVSPIEALRGAVARPRDPDDAGTWTVVDGVHIHYEAGRLHAREFIGDHAVDDWYGLTVSLSGCDLPDTLLAAAIGRRLGEIVGLGTTPALLVDLDPVVTRVERVADYFTKALATGLLVTLELGSETLADVPSTALAAVGKTRRNMLRGELPWLGARRV